MKKGSFILLGLFMTLILMSCKKRISSGFGGNAILTIRAFHHTLPIDSFMAFVKFNAQDAPADNTYDTQGLSILNSDSTYSVTIPGLKKGDYYLYVSGWDSTIQEVVKGGIPYKITEESSINAIVAVTEGH